MNQKVIFPFLLVLMMTIPACHQNKIDVINPVNNLPATDTSFYKTNILSRKDEYKTGENAVFDIEFSATKNISTKIIATFPDSDTEIQIDKISDTQYKYITLPLAIPGEKTLSVAFYDADKLNELQKKKEDLQATIDTLNKKQYVFKDKTVQDQINSYNLELEKTSNEINSQKPLAQTQKTITVKEDIIIPPDPLTLITGETGSINTTSGISADFLYTGTNPVQTGVSSSTIDTDRVAIIRGKVLDKDSKAVPGVGITILNHSEYGKTLSRADGMFDMVVNGGGNLMVIYAKNGYLPVHRGINTPWQDFVYVPDVVMTTLD